MLNNTRQTLLSNIKNDNNQTEINNKCVIANRENQTSLSLYCRSALQNSDYYHTVCISKVKQWSCCQWPLLFHWSGIRTRKQDDIMVKLQSGVLNCTGNCQMKVVCMKRSSNLWFHFMRRNTCTCNQLKNSKTTKQKIMLSMSLDKYSMAEPACEREWFQNQAIKIRLSNWSKVDSQTWMTMKSKGLIKLMLQLKKMYE